MEIFLTSIIAFVSTNIDDIFILALFFGNKKINDREIIAGQFLGIISLITISMIGSLIGLLLPQAYVGLLGIIPIYLGAKSLWNLLHATGEDNENADVNSNRKNHILAVAGVTIANGGDNIGIYIPLFATLTWLDKGMMTIIFLVMTLLWCLMAKYFTTHPYVAKQIDKYGHIITPFVLILLGFYILYENGTFTMGS
jgi:cadmium resistance transport/sequestration family protein